MSNIAIKGKAVSDIWAVADEGVDFETLLCTLVSGKLRIPVRLCALDPTLKAARVCARHRFGKHRKNVCMCQAEPVLNRWQRWRKRKLYKHLLPAKASNPAR